MIAGDTSPSSLSIATADGAGLPIEKELLEDLLRSADTLERLVRPILLWKADSRAAQAAAAWVLASPSSAAVIPCHSSEVCRDTSTEAIGSVKPKGKGLQLFEDGKRYFEEHKKSLLQDFAGKYIAIVNGRVVDSDLDSGQLALRVYKRFGYKAIYMPYVSARPEIAHIPSPWIVETR